MVTEKLAKELIEGDKVFMKQVEGNGIDGNIKHLKTPAVITHTWVYGATITILTKRGYVELDHNWTVEVA